MRTLLAVVLVLVLAPAGAAADSLSAISRPYAPQDAELDSYAQGLSADGRFVVLVSAAPNLLQEQEDTNKRYDIFLRDRLAGTTVLVSHASGNPRRTGNGESRMPQISADGRFVVFLSLATDLVPNQVDANRGEDVFVYDRVRDEVALVSHAFGAAATAGNAGYTGDGIGPRISRDGTYIAFTSPATDLTSGAGGEPVVGLTHVFLAHRPSGAVTLVSHNATQTSAPANGRSSLAALSADGGTVVFASYGTDLVPGLIDTNGSSDLYAFSRSTGALLLVSRAQGTTATAGHGASFAAATSADGRFIAFYSSARNLTNGLSEAGASLWVFLFDRLSGAMTLVSHKAGAANVAVGSVQTAALALTPDGRFLAFVSTARNLVAGQVDTNGGDDAFLFDRLSGRTELVSHKEPSRTAAGGGGSRLDLSDDGRFVAFSSRSHLAAFPPAPLVANQVFLYDRTAGRLTLVSHPSSLLAACNDVSGYAWLSADGRFLAFASNATNLAGGQVDVNHFGNAFLYERATDTVKLLTRAARPGATVPLYPSNLTALSADGSSVLFQSYANTLIAGLSNVVDYEPLNLLYLQDAATHRTALVEHGSASPIELPNGLSSPPYSVSADGRFVAFSSRATNLVAGATYVGPGHAFLYDRTTGATTLLSHAAGNPKRSAEHAAAALGISADGRYVALLSRAVDLVAGQVGGDVANLFLYDRLTGQNQLVTHKPGAPLTAANGSTVFAQVTLSGDGRYVLFTSDATDLVAGVLDTNDQPDLFLFDRETGETILVSRAADSPTAVGSEVYEQGLDLTGRFVAFTSAAPNLVAGQVDGNEKLDVFLFDRAAGTMTLVSHRAGSPLTTADGTSRVDQLSADGSGLAFSSDAVDLVAPLVDENEADDQFLYRRATGATVLVSHAAGAPDHTAQGASVGGRIRGDGQAVAFFSNAPDIVSGQEGVPGVNTAFLYNLFLYDAPTTVSLLVSHAAGAPRRPVIGSSSSSAIDQAGDRIAFDHTAGDLLEGDYNSTRDVFLWSRTP